MDPTETLRSIREALDLVSEIEITDSIGCLDESKARDLESQALHLVGLIEGLDKWLTEGGYLPGQWSKARVP